MSEIGMRIGCSLMQVRNMLPFEFRDALLDSGISISMLQQRIDCSALTFIGGKMGLWDCARASKFFKEVAENEIVQKETEFRGTTAFPGFARGIVKIINASNDIAKMNKGDILVSHATEPRLVPAMEKAAAIVTDMGGLTCHAAIVSREMRIPCVVGTKVATKVLKDGDLVEVNATEGAVRKL
jgi:pyruvate,water dikinase